LPFADGTFSPNLDEEERNNEENNNLETSSSYGSPIRPKLPCKKISKNTEEPMSKLLLEISFSYTFYTPEIT
jgi:hypothetical protein